MNFREDMQPRVDHEDKDVLDPVFDEEGNEIDVEALIDLFYDDPASLTEDELLYIPDELFDPEHDPNEFMANLAEGMDDQDLTLLAQDICQWRKDDEQSRAAWEERIVRGIKFLGTSDETEGGAGDPDDGFARVVHPGIHEARTQFQARAIAEVWPSSGPVKTRVLGVTSEEVNKQSIRVREYLNYLYLHKMTEAYSEEERMEYWLPITGSCFKKVTWDPIANRPRIRFIQPSKFFIPADAVDLETAPHFIEEFEETGNETNRKIKAGIYRKVTLQDPDATSHDRTDLEDTIISGEGRRHVGYFGDQAYKRLECYVYLILPGDEDRDDEGRLTGVAKPYIITVDQEDEKTLAIYRGWKEGDDQFQRRVFHVHFRFLPGSYFFGDGLLHSIGGLSESATGALRALLDAAFLRNRPGGFVSQEVDMAGGDLEYRAGQWKMVRASGEAMRNGFFTPPAPEPSMVLFNLLGFLTEQMQRFASTTEVMVGDAANSAPVGTTLAQIEQGSKVFSGIHKRLHMAHAQEYRLVAELVAENIPEGGYPYAMEEGVGGEVMEQDFDERIDVIPVSDPNIVSQDQRIAKAQSAYQLGTQHPDMFNLRVLTRDLLSAMGITNIEEMMPEPGEAPALDPVSEFMAILKGDPVQAGPDQDHASHVAFMQNAILALPPETQADIEPQFKAVFRQHLAMGLKQQIETQTGQAVEEVPPEMLASMQIQPLAPDAPGDRAAHEAMGREQGRKDMEAQAKVGLETEKVMGDQRRKDAQTMTGMDLDLLAMDSEQQRKDAMAVSKLLSDAQTGVLAAERQAEQTNTTLRDINDEQ